MHQNMEFVIKKEQELLEFLYENIDKSKKEVKNYLIHEKVYVNNKIVTKYNFMLKPKMSVIVNLSKEEFNILYEDKDIIVVDKPYNLLTVATDKEKEITLFHLVSNYVKSKNKSFKVFIVHRLDKETSGIVLLAKNEKTKQILQNNWEEIAIKRKYVAIANGVFKNKSGTVTSYLKENTNYMVYSSNEGKLAITNYQVIKQNNLYAWVEIEIKTGRKNQIRVHMKDLEHIIVGDKKYGDKSKQKRMYLHANELVFIHPYSKKEIKINSPVPFNMK